MISDEQLQAWERLANEATDGPWAIGKYGGGVVRVGHELRDVATRCNRDEDAAFIAGAREAVPALIARVRDLEKDINWLTKQFNGPKLIMSYGHVCPDTEKDLCDGYTFKAFEGKCAKCWRNAAIRARRKVKDV